MGEARRETEDYGQARGVGWEKVTGPRGKWERTRWAGGGGSLENRARTESDWRKEENIGQRFTQL